MELTDYLRILRRGWILLVSITLAGLLTGGAISLAIQPTYTAETKLFLATQNSGSVQELQQVNNFGQDRVQSYAQIVTTPAVLQPAIESLGLETSPGQLASRITANAGVNTVLLTIRATNPSPVQAAAIAQAVSESLIKVIDQLESPSAGGTPPVRLSVVTPATAPSTPSAPNTRLNLVIGALLGFVIGLGAVVLRNVLNTKVKGELDLRRITDAPILGGIAYDSDAAKKPLLTQFAPQSARAESFRQIRTNLQFAQVAHKSKTVLITSSLPGEGKTTTAVNMALALAQAGKSVALVDADLRRPMVGEYLGLDRNAGLTTVLIGSSSAEELLHPWGKDQLYVLTSGQVPPNPSELLGSESMAELIEELERQFDAVVIDAPPLLPVTDAAVLAQRVSGVVLVVGSQAVTTADVEKSLSALEMVDAALLGVVLNKLPSKGQDAYTYTYASYESAQPNPKEGLRGIQAARESSSSGEFDELVFGSSDNQFGRK